MRVLLKRATVGSGRRFRKVDAKIDSDTGSTEESNTLVAVGDAVAGKTRAPRFRVSGHAAW